MKIIAFLFLLISTLSITSCTSDNEAKTIEPFSITISLDFPDMFTSEQGNGYLYKNYTIKYENDKLKLAIPKKGQQPDFVFTEGSSTIKADQIKKINKGYGQTIYDLDTYEICNLGDFRGNENTTSVDTEFDLPTASIVVISCHVDGGDDPYYAIAIMDSNKKLFARTPLTNPYSCSFYELKLIDNLNDYISKNPDARYATTIDTAKAYEYSCEEAEFTEMKS